MEVRQCDHHAAYRRTIRLQARRIELFMENLARFDKGEPMFNVVDKIGILGSQARDIPEQSARMKRD
jgi:hypothetical protein